MRTFTSEELKNPEKVKSLIQDYSLAIKQLDNREGVYRLCHEHFGKALEELCKSGKVRLTGRQHVYIPKREQEFLEQDVFFFPLSDDKTVTYKVQFDVIKKKQSICYIPLMMFKVRVKGKGILHFYSKQIFGLGNDSSCLVAFTSHFSDRLNNRLYQDAYVKRDEVQAYFIDMFSDLAAGNLEKTTGEFSVAWRDGIGVGQVECFLEDKDTYFCIVNTYLTAEMVREREENNWGNSYFSPLQKRLICAST